MEMLKVPFLGNELIIVDYNGKPYALMKQITENIGLDWRAQRKRIMRNHILSKGVVMITTPSNGGEQDTLALPLHFLSGWLFGIDTKRVKEHLREKLERYQLECYEVLWQYWTTGVARRDEVKARLAAIDEAEYQSAIRGSMAGRDLNRRRLEKRELERQKFAVLQMDLFFQAA